MKQVHEDICAPQGFAAAGTYSGVYADRVKVDLAMIVSPKPAAIVTIDGAGIKTATGSVLVVHHGAALPVGARAAEITDEIRSAAATQLHRAVTDVQFVACGVPGQYFRPSLVVHSLPGLVDDVAAADSSIVRRVVDTDGDVTSVVVPVEGTQGHCQMGGIAADGTADEPGLCLITTDGDVSPAAIRSALQACQDDLNLKAYTVVVMANGMVSQNVVTTGALTQSFRHLFKSLGFTQSLRECS